MLVVRATIVGLEGSCAGKLTFNGLAVENCGIIAAFDNGTVVCLRGHSSIAKRRLKSIYTAWLTHETYEVQG